MLTREQIQSNIQALEKQGASQKDIQSWLDSLQTSNTRDTSQQTQEQPEKKSLGRKILDFGVSTAKSLAEAGIRTMTETNPVLKSAKPLIPESVKLPIVGETSVRYADDPKKRLGQMGEDLLAALPSPTVSGAKNLLLGARNKATAELAEMTLKSGKVKQVVSKDAWEVVKPSLSKTETVTKLMSGQAKQKGLLREVVLKPTQQELKMAKSVEGIVDPKKSFVENIYSVKQEIGKEADNVIKGLEKNNRIYPQKELNAVLGRIEKPISVKADPVLNNYYDLAREKFLDFASKEKGNLSGLLKARKNFDSWVEQEIPKIWDDPRMSGLNKALKDMRAGANDFIASKLPAGNMFKQSLQKQSLMFDALDNIATKNYKEVGTNVIQRTLQKNPTLKAGLKYGAGGAGLGWVGSKLLGD